MWPLDVYAVPPRISVTVTADGHAVTGVDQRSAAMAMQLQLNQYQTDDNEQHAQDMEQNVTYTSRKGRVDSSTTETH